MTPKPKKITSQEINTLKAIKSAISDHETALSNVAERGVPGAIRPHKQQRLGLEEDRDGTILRKFYERMPSEKQREFWQLKRSVNKISFLLQWGSLQ